MSVNFLTVPRLAAERHPTRVIRANKKMVLPICPPYVALGGLAQTIPQFG